MTANSSTQYSYQHDFFPLVCGSDALGYSYTREFADVYHKTSHMLSPLDIKFSSKSRFNTFELVPHVDQPDVLMNWLRTHATQFATGEFGNGDAQPLVLAAASDWHVRVLSQYKQELQDLGYIIPYIDFDLLDDITQKDRFYTRCEKLGIPYPRTLVVWFDQEEKHHSAQTPCSQGSQSNTCGSIDQIEATALKARELEYPVIVKPSNSANWHYAEVADKHKVYLVNTADELETIFKNVADSSYEYALLVQEVLNTSDEAIKTITTFSDENGQIITGVCAQVLVQDRSATGIGNPLVIMGQNRDQELLDYAAKFLADCKYQGYANFDVMLDCKGHPRFLEVNTRPGRNTYYVSLAGCSFVKPLVETYVYKHDPRTSLTSAELDAHDPFLFSMVPKSVIAKETHGQNRTEALALWDAKKWQNPLLNPRDCLAQRFWARINFEHMRSKFSA